MILKKLSDIYDFAKSNIEYLKSNEDRLLEENTEKLKDAAAAFKSRYENNVREFEENEAAFKKREQFKSKLAFADESGKSPAEHRGDQVRVLKKLREYFIKEINQSEAVTRLEDDYKKIRSDIAAADHFGAIVSGAKAAVDEQIAQTVKATKKFFCLMLLISAALAVGLFVLLKFTGMVADEDKRLIVAIAVSAGVFVLSLIALLVISAVLRAKNKEKLLLLAEDTEQFYIPSYVERHGAASAEITEGMPFAINDLTDRNTAFLEKLTEYYLSFLPDNIVYIINPVIDGLESGMSFGDAVWKSNERLYLDAKHAEIMNCYKLISDHLYSLEDLQQHQITEQKRQLAAINAQTAAVAANAAATIAQNAEIYKQREAINRMANEIKNTGTI